METSDPACFCGLGHHARPGARPIIVGENGWKPGGNRVRGDSTSGLGLWSFPAGDMPRVAAQEIFEGSELPRARFPQSLYLIRIFR